MVKNVSVSVTTYAGADLRGRNFGSAKLAGASFAGAHTGLGTAWRLAYLVGAALVALFAGMLLGAGPALTTFALIAPPDQSGIWSQTILPLLGLAVLAVLVAFMLRRELERAVVTGAALAACSVVALVLFDVNKISGPLTLLALGYGVLLAGVVILAVVLALVYVLAHRSAAATMLALSALAAAPAYWEVIVTFEHPNPFEPPVPAQLAAGVPIALLFFWIAVLLARATLAGHERLAVMHDAMVKILAARATSFFGADLTDADFSGADLSFSDLRKAVLTRTNWQDARGLERALLGDSYLADHAVRQLVISKQGAQANFDGANLTGVNLDGANLRDASFVGANLNQASLQMADLNGATLVHTRLYDTNLSHASITGAIIEHWGISSQTKLDDLSCDYVYLHLPTAADRDPMRKPDNPAKIFAPGEFNSFLAPAIRPLGYIQHNSVSRPESRTLDIIQRPQNGVRIDPALSALAFQHLAQRHPEAGLEIVALKTSDDNAVQISTLVSTTTDRSQMSEEFDEIYAYLAARPPAERMRLIQNLLESDDRNQLIADMLQQAYTISGFRAETRIIPRIKCLLITASPLDGPALRLGAELRAITQKLRATDYRDVFQLIPLYDVHLDDLYQALNEHRPWIVQFSGHGYDDGQLAFVDDAGNAVPVSVEALGSTFAVLKDDIRLVILNACYSAEQIGAIADVIDCVIGMRDRITDDAAIVFVAAFYRALGAGRSLANAFDQAVSQLKHEFPAEAEIPQLLACTGAEPEKIVLVAPHSTLTVGANGTRSQL
jgi:uncharacterized protein YjbI with pentapeptide repeats